MPREPSTDPLMDGLFLTHQKKLLVSFGLRIIRKREKEVNEHLTEPGEKQAIWFPLLPLDLISFYPFSPRTCLDDNFLLSASAFSCRKIYHGPLANMSTLRRQWQCAFLSLPDVIPPPNRVSLCESRGVSDEGWVSSPGGAKHPGLTGFSCSEHSAPWLRGLTSLHTSSLQRLPPHHL